MSQPSPTAAQVAAAEEIVARIVSADAIAGRRSGEARQAHGRAIMATVLAEREAAVRAETWEAAAQHVEASGIYMNVGLRRKIAASLREAARG